MVTFINLTVSLLSYVKEPDGDSSGRENGIAVDGSRKRKPKYRQGDPLGVCSGCSTANSRWLEGSRPVTFEEQPLVGFLWGVGVRGRLLP